MGCAPTDDEVLSLDYDDFIKKLNEFSRAYNFFKTFDSNRDNLINAIEFKNSLLTLEDKISATIKAIFYREKIESREFSQIDNTKMELENTNKTYRKKSKNIEETLRKFEKRLKIKINGLEKEIVKLEALKEKFDSIEIEKNIELASRHESVEKELDENKFAQKQLQKKLTSVQKIIESQIEQLHNKIKTTIPSEMNKKFYDLSEVEKQNHEEDRLLIDNEYDALEQQLLQEIEAIEAKIESVKKTIEGIESTIFREVKELRAKSENQIKMLRSNLRLKNDEKYSLESRLINLKKNKDIKDNELRKHKDKYDELRSNNAKSLWTTRKYLNQKIAVAKDILHPTPNSFKEFLANEIEEWEKEIYPILDKTLLLKSCDELKPVKLDTPKAIGFQIDASKLENIDTKDEAIEKIKNAKFEKSQALKNAKSVYQDEIAKLDEMQNKIIADMESLQTQINNTIGSIGGITIQIKKLENEINENEACLEKDITVMKRKFEEDKNSQFELKKKFESRVNEKKLRDLKELKKKRGETITKRAKARDENINIIKKKIENEKTKEIEKVQGEIRQLKSSSHNTREDKLIYGLSLKIEKLQQICNTAYDARKYLEEYEAKKEDILRLPVVIKRRDKLDDFIQTREATVSSILLHIENKTEEICSKIEKLVEKNDKYEKGLKKYKQHQFDDIDEEIESQEYLIDLIIKYEEYARDYQNDKSKFRTLIDKLKKVEKHSLIEINFNNENFDEVKSIKELSNILESLGELENFEKNKYESEKKRRHNNFDTFLRNTLPSKLKSFDDLEIDFEKAKNGINKNLLNADFGVIKDIKLVTDISQKNNDTIASLMKQLSKKAADTVGLYSQKSLFYYDISRSVDNINEIGRILEEIKQKSSKGMVNLFDTIDLSISYVENGKKIENKESIKDDSSSGGNILLKVAIAISVLTRYANKTNQDTPFFLIIDEISKLQSKNQDLLKDYINKNGFKTLFITPDPVYPNPDKALYYTFRSIQQEGENLEIRQMNIV